MTDNYSRSKEYLELLGSILTGYAWLATASLFVYVLFRADIQDLPTQLFRLISIVVCIGTSIAAVAAMAIVAHNYGQRHRKSAFGFVVGWLLAPIGLVIFLTPAVIYSVAQAFQAITRAAS